MFLALAVTPCYVLANKDKQEKLVVVVQTSQSSIYEGNLVSLDR
jgi:hypothetical protein